MMKKEINGKLCELVEQTEDGLCAGCIARGNEDLCETTGDECTTVANSTKIWKDVSDEQN